MMSVRCIQVVLCQGDVDGKLPCGGGEEKMEGRNGQSRLQTAARDDKAALPRGRLNHSDHQIWYQLLKRLTKGVNGVNGGWLKLARFPSGNS